MLHWVWELQRQRQPCPISHWNHHMLLAWGSSVAWVLHCSVRRGGRAWRQCGSRTSQAARGATGPHVRHPGPNPRLGAALKEVCETGRRDARCCAAARWRHSRTRASHSLPVVPGCAACSVLPTARERQSGRRRPGARAHCSELSAAGEIKKEPEKVHVIPPRVVSASQSRVGRPAPP